ncbi:uncharacterized protein LOC115949820 [Quercus lobata]|uniref:uncharacterized protein LOC115949820 n=1 Tax=Quercus lobata TaxID=97700 RepID=UPI001244C967|nr:uncharacterized protein LOC115949820 [Quercus lobata]
MKVSRQTISFDEEDLEGTIQPHDDALVVTAQINGFLVKRVMIDQESGADVMYPDLFEGLRLKNQDLVKYDTPLVSFDGRVVIPEGQISLSVDMEGKEVMVTFIVVRSFSPHTAILGRPWIHAMKAILSTLHVKVKFPTEYGVAVVRGIQRVARQCLVTAVRWKGEQKPRGETGADGAEEVLKNVDVFAWSPYEVLGVGPEFIVHKLNVDPSFPPKKQRSRRASKEHVDAINLEVQRLKEAGVIREIFFPEWLANTVVVKKKNGKWRVCVDFTNLNRACPKDPFPMPKIDQLVDATYGHPRMSFSDAFQGYHQIALAPEDREKTAFIFPDANYHYEVMPFGLKNAGATY